MTYNAELNFGISWSIRPLHSNVLGVYNPRNFVSDKAAIYYFSYCSVQSNARAFFVLKLIKPVFFKIS
jgi:hypothetical protein